MTAQITFFPVGDGDRTLVRTEGDHRNLIDMNIRSDSEDPDNGTPGVVAKLRDKLVRDAWGHRTNAGAFNGSALRTPPPLNSMAARHAHGRARSYVCGVLGHRTAEWRTC